MEKEAKQKAEKEARHKAEEEAKERRKAAEQSGAAGKGKGNEKAMEQGDCVCCKKRGIECVPPTESKVTSCAACQSVRAKCM